MSKRSAVAAALWVVAASGGARAATLEVGPGQTYTLPCQAIGAASPGDIIEVDANGNGSYDGDSCSWSTDDLTVRGINGRASINAGGDPTQDAGGPSNIAEDKGIFVIAAPNATIENFELSGAVADTCPHGGGCSNNGAGIRHQGTNLTVRNCSFHDNQDGILAGPPTPGTGTILIELSEFFANGQGDGYSHNMYIGESALFILQYSYSHESVVGHLVKSRAYENHIQYNLLADLADGTGSYELDLPQGGLSYVIGNAIEQGPLTQNPTIVTYAEENQNNPTQVLYLVNNTVVNDLGSGTFLNVGGAPTVTLINNILHGSGTLPGGLTAAPNWTDAMGDPQLVDPSTYDYALQSSSPCVDAGIDPGLGDGQPLEPIGEYVATAGGMTRDDAHWDLGAFELGDVGSPVDGGIGLLPDAGYPFGSGGATTTSTTTAGSSTSSGAGTSGGASGTATTTGSSGAHGSTGSTATGSTASGSSSGHGSTSSSGATTTSSGSGAAASTASTGGTSSAAGKGGCGCGSGSTPSAWLALIGGLGLSGPRRRRGPPRSAC